MRPRLTVMQLLPALEGGGAERGALEVAAALVSSGARSLIVSAGGRLVPQLEAAGSTHLRLAIGAKSPWVLARMRRLRQAIVDHRVDIVHARSRLPAWLGWGAVRTLRPRPAFVTTLHGLNSVSFYSAIMTRGDRAIAVSEACRSYWLQHFPTLDATRVTVIHRGIDPAEFAYGAKPERAWIEAFQREFEIAPGKPLLTLPGRVSRYKGHDAFVELIAYLNARGRDCLGLIVGGFKRRSNYRARLQRKIRQLGLTKHIVFTGHRADLTNILAISDLVFNLASKPESFGRIAAEALALGRPVVGYAHAGIGEILEAIYPCGMVPPNDHRTLCERSEQLLQTPIPVPNHQPFLKAEMIKQTLDVYRQLVAMPDASDTS